MIASCTVASKQREQSDPSDRLTPRPLELVVHLGVLELLEVEHRRMTHQLDAGAVGEEIAEEALEQRRDPGQSLTGQGNRHFDREQLDESRPVDGRAGARDV